MVCCGLCRRHVVVGDGPASAPSDPCSRRCDPVCRVRHPATAAASGGLGLGTGLDITWSDGGLPLLERTLQPDSSGWWSVTVEDGCSSPASDSIFLTVLPPFDRQVVFGELTCHGDSTSLLLDATEPVDLLHVVEGDSLGAGPHLLEALAGQALAWTLVDPVEGCTSDTTLLVPGHPPPTAAFFCESRNGLHSLGDAQPVGLIDLSSGADSGQWQWTPLQTNDNTSAADSIAWSAGTNPSLTLPASGTWSLQFTVAQDAGCADTVSQTLCILPPTSIWLPDAFSPNGDGANDWLRPRGSGIARWTMTVHDRWGQRLWEGGQQELPAGTALPPTTNSGFPVDGMALARRPGSTPFPSKPPLMGARPFPFNTPFDSCDEKTPPASAAGRAGALGILPGHNGRPRGGGAVGRRAARTGAPRRLGTGNGRWLQACNMPSAGPKAAKPFTPNGWAPVGEWATAGRHNAGPVDLGLELHARPPGFRVDGRPPPRRRGPSGFPLDKGWNGAAGLGLAWPIGPSMAGIGPGTPNMDRADIIQAPPQANPTD